MKTQSLRENDSAILDEVMRKQVESMIEMIGAERLMDVSQSPRGATFSARGCIGQVRFRDGSALNIVPDLPGVKDEGGSNRFLMRMLYTVFGMDPEKEVHADLFEFFVRVFVDTINRLLNKGMRSKYHSVSGNEKAFKGRIMFNEHIRENYIHKERIYVEYETYSQNRPENRLIKSTLEALQRRTTDSRNSKSIKTLVLEMDDIPSSPDVDRDFDMCIIDRNMSDYVAPLMWCNIFLKGMGLGGSSKGNFCYTLLVRTDVLYAAYVAKMSVDKRTDGAYLIKYDSTVNTDGGSNGVSAIIVNLDWSFYNREKGVMEKNAESLFMSAPGYRVIPHIGGGSRLRSMAGSYLADTTA